MPERIKRRTYKLTFFFFVALFVFQGIFVSFQIASADSWAGTEAGRTPVSAPIQTPNDPTTQANGGSATSQTSTAAGCSMIGFFTGETTCVVQSILVGLRNFAGWLAGGAASLFVWVVDPANVTGPTGMLNKVSVYNLWKFIRDFFNLFFILILLFSAFATIFQIEAFSIRKIFFNILLSALIINFSFPITRLLIDMTNVPMYYFLNIAVEGTSSGALKITESFLGASGMSSVFMGGSSFWQLLMNVIFIFLFAISLLVLAVLMLIRVVALVLLVIFSPVGFAASLLPGTEKLGRDWWNYFWKYAFFGPSAALMLMVSVRFMNEIGNDGTFGSMIATSTAMSAGSFQSSAIAQITFLTIPLILIWSAIGMANSASIAGAGKVTGWGYGAARKVGGWTRRGAWGATKLVLPTNIAKGVAAGAKDGLKTGKWFGGDLNKVRGGKFLTGKYYTKRAEDKEAKWKGTVTGGVKGGQSEIDKLQAKRQYEAAKEMKDNNVSNTDLLKALKGDDKTKSAAAAMVLTDRKAIKTTDDLEKAIKVLGVNTKEIAEVIEKADRAALQGLDPGKYKSIISSQAFVDPKNGDQELVGSLHARMEKEGLVKNRLDYELHSNRSSMNEEAAREKAYKDVLNGLSTDDLGKQGSLIESMNKDQHLRQYYADKIKKSDPFYQDAMKKMTHANREVWMSIKEGIDQQKRATSAAKPGDQVSAGGIIIPGGSKSV